MPQKNRGQGRTDHVPHGNIEQRNQKAEGRNQTLLHNLHFL